MATPDHSFEERPPSLNLWSRVALAYLLLYAIWLLLGPLTTGEQLLVGNLGVVFPTALSACLVFWLTGKFGLEKSARRAWRILGAGLLLWVVSSSGIIPNGFTLTLPSFWLTAVDFAFLAGYAAVLASLICFPRPLRRGFTPLRLYGDMLISTAAVLTLGWLVVIHPFLNAAPQSDLFHSLLFPTADLIVLIALMITFIQTELQSSSPGLGWVSLGLALILLGDLARDYLYINGLYQTANLVDLTWAAGYFSIGKAVLSEHRQIAPGYESAKGRGPQPVEGKSLRSLAWRSFLNLGRTITRSIQSTLPFMATFLLGGYALSDWSLNAQADPLGLWMTVLLCLFLVARQGMLAGEREFQQYTILVNSIAEPAFICDGKGRLKLVNPALLSSMGYVDDHALLDQPMLCLLAAGIQPNNLLQTALGTGWSGETLFQRKDGSTYPGYLSLRPIRHAAVERLALAGTAHDLTLQKDQQEALQMAYDQIAAAHHDLEMLNEQLEQKVAEKTGSLSEAYKTLEQQNQTLQMLDELKSDFVSLVSHELRAPLTNISGGIELVLSSPQTVPYHARQSLTLVQSEIRRLTHFVETILDLSALDAGRMPFSTAPLALEDIIEALDYQVKAMGGGERVCWPLADGLPLIQADEHALESILFHLIDNAIKYASQGEITVTANADANLMYVRVCDRGPGIPPEALPLLFKKFYRLHRGDAQTVYGHGLGLYIVRRLLQAMGGDIRCDNLPEGGACFTFWLPAIEEKDEHEIVVS